MKKSSASKILQAMKAEIVRSHERLRAPGHPKPYFLSYLIRDVDQFTVWGSYGALGHSLREKNRSCFVDVRVGSFAYDQVTKGGLEKRNQDDDNEGSIDLPIDDDCDAIQFALWRHTDTAYRDAVRSFHKRKSRDVSYLDENKAFPSFQRQKSEASHERLTQVDIDQEAWRLYVRNASRVLKKYPEIKNSYVEYSTSHQTKLFMSSEGSEKVWQETIHSLTAYAWFHSKKANEEANITIHCSNSNELPSLHEFKKMIQNRVEKLYEVEKGDVMTSYSGPVLLAPKPSGLLIHEVVGHRLEGSRLLSDEEGRTLKDKVGKKIMHADLSIFDDPTLKIWQKETLIGHFPIDDEGSPACRVDLVKHGILKGFLTTRTPLRAKNHENNGHARNQRSERPISRMGNLIVESHSDLEWKDLKNRLMDLVKEQNQPFGMILLEVEGGETGTEAYNFQAFLGEVTLAIKVFPDGREVFVRGVDFVGTPLAALSHIVAVGRKLEVDNGFCGAESGTVPVSTVAPALLLSTLELQTKDSNKMTQYALPLPWFDAKDGRD